MRDPNKAPRKKFLLWATALLSSVTIFKFIKVSGKPGLQEFAEKKETIKMLTQDGKLVEVDAEMITSGKRSRITDEQLKNFVSKK
jgi:hypothetical protein